MKGIPLYVTRKTASGYTGSLTVNAWLYAVLVVLLLANALTWSAYALYLAGAKWVEVLT